MDAPQGCVPEVRSGPHGAPGEGLPVTDRLPRADGQFTFDLYVPRAAAYGEGIAYVLLCCVEGGACGTWPESGEPHRVPIR